VDRPTLDEGIGEVMSNYPQAIVHHLLAAQLQKNDETIKDSQSLDGLGLDPFDLVLFVLKLEELIGGEDAFPFRGLERAETVGDLVALVDLWCNATHPSSSENEGPPSRSVA
jgi:acyl carrier protein